MENITLAFRNGLSNYVNFSGRASRPEFWWWVLSIILLAIVIGLIDSFIINPVLGLGTNDDSRLLSTLLGLAIIIPNIALGVRRLHDTGKSGWWILIGLIPLVGWLILIYFYVQPSEDCDNDHGPKPSWPPASA